MADHAKPTTTSHYVDFVAELNGRMQDLARGLDPATSSPTNLPTDAVRWTSTLRRWQRWTGAAWVDLTDGYNIPLAGPIRLDANSSDPALRITQTGAGHCLLVEDVAGDNTPLAIDAAGAVVSGAPAMPAGFDPAGVAIVGNGTFRHFALARVSESASGPTQYFQKARGSSYEAPAALVDSDVFGSHVYQGYNGAATLPGVTVRALVDGAPSATSMPGAWEVWTTPAGAAATVRRLRIDAAGLASFYAGLSVAGGLRLPPTVSAAASGSTVTVTAATSVLLLNHAATVATLTIALPATPGDGQTLSICARSAVTALTLSGGTVYGAPASLSAGGSVSFIYSATAAAWWRRG